MTIARAITTMEHAGAYGKSAIEAKDTAIKSMKALLELQKTLNHRGDDMATMYAGDDLLYGTSRGYYESAKLVKQAIEEIENEKLDE